MKKKVLLGVGISLFIAIIAVVVCVIIGVIRIPGMGKKTGNETDLDRIKKVMEETRPTDVFILGKDIQFEVDINTKKVAKLTQEELDSDKDYKVIIINDLDGEISLSDDEIKYAENLIKKNGYLLIYLGEKYAKEWNVENEGIANLSDNLCYSYYSWDGNPKRVVGQWLQSDQDELEKYPYSLGQTMLYCIEEYLMTGQV